MYSLQTSFCQLFSVVLVAVCFPAMLFCLHHVAQATGHDTQTPQAVTRLKNDLISLSISFLSMIRTRMSCITRYYWISMRKESFSSLLIISPLARSCYITLAWSVPLTPSLNLLDDTESPAAPICCMKAKERFVFNAN